MFKVALIMFLLAWGNCAPSNFEDNEVMDMKTQDDENNILDIEDPLINPDLFEGDILGINITDDAADRSATKTGAKWKNGVVPYVISSSFSSSEKSIIKAGMADYHSKTCIKFVPRSSEKDYISIGTGGGCSSFVGRQGGRQIVTLGRGCVIKGTVIHELMHAVGFWHEQSRPDRDSYVTVHYGNIQSGMEYNFQKYSWNKVQDLGVPYDVGSVMHYTSNAFSKNGKPTITRRSGSGGVGNRKGFSSSDIKEINAFYKCKGKGRRSYDDEDD